MKLLATYHDIYTCILYMSSEPTKYNPTAFGTG